MKDINNKSLLTFNSALAFNYEFTFTRNTFGIIFPKLGTLMHVRPEVGRIPIGTFGKWFSLCIQTDRPSSLLDLLHEIFGNAFTSSIKFQLCLKEEGGEGASLCFVSVFGKILSQH